MKFRFNIFIFLICGVILLAGCRALNPSIMLRTTKDFKYASFPPSPPVEYRVAPNDMLSFSIFSNDGFKLIDLTSVDGRSSGGNAAGLKYKIEFDGTIKLPLIGRTKLEGMTVRETENYLEEKYSAFYNKPYVLAEVSNRRVIIFPGSAGAAKVVNLTNENTTLLEALALAGGISASGKAYKVKLIRGSLKTPQVYLIDLSTIEGMKQADLIMQANDIIYIEQQLRVEKEVIAEILPYLSFITTMFVFYEFIITKKP